MEDWKQELEFFQLIKTLESITMELNEQNLEDMKH